MKLCGVALQRKVPITNRKLRMHDFVYLPPEVLNGEYYTPPADMYGLGLLICELFIQKKVLIEERHMEIDDFMSKVNADSVLQSQYFALVPKKYHDIVGHCLNPDPSKRVVSKVLWNTLKKEP